MSLTPGNKRRLKAAEQLAADNKVAARLLAQHGPPALAPGAAPPERFEALASSIAYQQLAGKAAAAIWSRVKKSVGDDFTPAAVTARGPVELRECGLSNAKVASLLDLAEKCSNGMIQLEEIELLDDTDVIEHLTLVRGIGPWTAQMFLLFELERPDVWPTGDLGVRAGFARAFGLDEVPTQRQLEPLGDPFTPHRSIMAWWCWREADSPGGRV
ncbi:MAG: hypothetical protein WBA45_10380 [Microthrixaceae bacterium]